MAGFRREVALLALPVLSFLAVILCHLIKADAQTTAWIAAAATALGGIITSALAVPRHPQAIGAAVIALFTILSHYWWKLDANTIAAAVVVLNLLFGITVSTRITPVTGPPAVPPGA